ncbi:MAG: hypothetical protein CVU39_08945 [Chloroflexi bacterium HGW-Chloroflexi-10]|nr:MAG: hypothetical protein CVU39_08945 [Chloroflexi bacterium HGW-Chloroflexi-10]
MAERNLQRRNILDPAVADLLAGMEEKQAEARLPKRQREKKARERAKIRARREQRVTYDLPPELKQSVSVLAEKLSLPASQLATLALARFMQAYEKGEIDLAPYKKPSRSPRYDWKLVFPKEWWD